MRAATRSAPGINTAVDSTKAASQSQAMYRFLNNPSVTPSELIKPLQQAAREGCSDSPSPFVLIMHDWCKIDYKSHTSKKDLHQLTHQHDVGYDLTASLAVEAVGGIVLAPVSMHLRTNRQLHSTATKRPKTNARHLNQLLPTMDEIAELDLGRSPVHIIDREADSLGHFRAWETNDHLYLVRCDDRRVQWQGESILLSEINEKLDQDIAFASAGKALFHGKKVKREVAEVDVVLKGAYKTRINGKQKEISGKPVTLRVVFVRLVDKKGYILAEWSLLTNVPASEVDTATIGLWYYFRWRIESFFKMLKSAGHEVEYWQQTKSKAILCRILIASMACVYVWQLQRDTSEAAVRMRELLMKLSGRQTKHGVESTPNALLAGWRVLQAMLCLFENGDTLDQIYELGKNYGPTGFFV